MSDVSQAATDSGPSEEDIIASFAEDDAPEASESGGEKPAESQAPGEGEEAEGEAAQAADSDPNDEPPEYWSKERKALWAKVTDPELRAAIRGHVDDASRAISAKMEEAAKARKESEDKAARFEQERAQQVSWWQANGQAINRAVMGKWADFVANRVELAKQDPARYTELNAQYEAEMAQLRDLNSRQQVEAERVRQSQEAKDRESRATEHAKLAQKFPKEFGAEKAQETYDTLSKYLLDQGIQPDRLKGIYEEAVVSTVLKAYKYDQLQSKVRGVTNPKPAAQSASTTPKRVAPGAARAANQGSDSERQAIERLRNGDASDDVLRWAFR